MTTKPSKIQLKSNPKTDSKSGCKKNNRNPKKCSKWPPKWAPKGEPFRAFFATCAPLAGHGFQHGSQKPPRRPQDPKISRFWPPKSPKWSPCNTQNAQKWFPTGSRNLGNTQPHTRPGPQSRETHGHPDAPRVNSTSSPQSPDPRHGGGECPHGQLGSVHLTSLRC